MAERLPFKSSDFLRGLRVANQSALAGIIDACSQDSPKAVRDSISRRGGVSTVISQVSIALSVLADYAYVKGLNLQDQLLAEDFDLAATLGLLSDVAAIASAASNVETNACLRAPAETTGQRANKEKTKVEG